jgi:hypothetical protein
MQGILTFLGDLIGNLDGWLESTIQFDQTLLDLYNQFIVPLPELFKILGGVLLSIIIVLGTFTFIKKLLKLFIVIAVIIVIVLAVTG